MPTTEDIPDEVLELLFSKLRVSDRKSVRLVNRRWFSLCNSASVTKHEQLRLRREDLKQVQILRGCLNLVINDCFDSVFDEDEDFWIKQGGSVRSLLVHGVGQRCPVLDKIFRYCPNITEFSMGLLIDYYSPRYDYCFAEDDVDDDSYEDDPIWDEIVSSDVDNSVCPKFDCLTSLTLSFSSFIKGPAFMKLAASVPRLRRLEMVEITQRKWSIREAIMTLIAKQSTTITELVFRRCRIATSEFIAQVLELVGPQLIRLHLIELPFTRIDSLKKHVSKFSNLQNLVFDDINLGLGENDMSFLGNFGKLEFLSLFGTRAVVNDLGLLPFGELANLKGLDIRNTEFTDFEVSKCFGGKMFPNLIALQLSCVADDVLAIILPNLKNLQFLGLSCLDSTMTNIGLKAIITNCKQLTHLDLIECCDTLDVTEPVSINDLPNLVHLNLNDCFRLNSRNISKLQLGELRSLGLRGVSLSVKGLKEILKNCPRLNNVNVSTYAKSGLSDVLRDAGILNVPPRSLSILDFCKN